MSHVTADRIYETTTTVGTGAITLGGAISGYYTFSSVMSTGDTCYYVIFDSITGANEEGVGTYTSAGNTLSRTTVLHSSNSNALVVFGTGAKLVFLTATASSLLQTTPSGTVRNSAVTTAGDLMVGSAVGTESRLAAGTASYVLQSGGPGVVPSWSPITTLPSMTGPISTPTYIDFATGVTPSTNVGRVWFDGTNTLNIQMTPNVVQKVGESHYFYAKASSAVSIGQVCMFTGTVGASSVITVAPSAGITDGSLIVGVAAESIALNDFGMIQSFGVLKGFDTSAFANGALLFYDPTVAGGFTATEPSAPSPKVLIAAVINSGTGGSGSIIIRITDYPSFNDLQDVQITSPSAGNVISYNGTIWTNSNITAGSNITITGGTTIATTATPTFTSVNGLTISTTTGTLSVASGSTISTVGAFPISITAVGTTSLTVPTSGVVTALGNTVTGGGAVVLANSPTIVNPIIGITSFSDYWQPAGSSATQATVTFQALGTDTNINVSLTPKGTGGIVLGPMPDGTATGGNTRGNYSVDLQISRTTASQVASGASSAILGGSNNSATANFSGIGGGSCVVSGIYAFGWGSANTINGSYSYHFGLSGSVRTRYGWMGHSSGAFVSAGDAQVGDVTMRISTAATTAARLTADGAAQNTANIVNLANNSGMRVTIDIVGRDTTTGDIGGWKLEAVVKRGAAAANTAIVGTVVSSVIALDTAWAAMTVPSLTADTTNGGLNLSVTPVTANTCHWVARVFVVEVI